MTTDYSITEGGTATPRFSGPKGTDIPIIGSSLVPKLSDLINDQGYDAYEKALDDFVACGFNGLNAEIDYVDRDKIPEILRRAYAKGVFVILICDAFRAPGQGIIDSWTTEQGFDKNKPQSYADIFTSRIREVIEKCKGQPGFAGVELYHEPTWGQLTDYYTPNGEDWENVKPELSDVISSEGTFYCMANCYHIVKHFLKKYNLSDRIIEVNLIGPRNNSYFNPSIKTYDPSKYDSLETAKYADYLDAFGAMVAGQGQYLWSYDIYPVKEQNYLLHQNFYLIRREYPDSTVTAPVLSDNGKIEVDYKYFYQDLEFFHERTKVPTSVFWTYVQSMVYFAGAWLHPVALEQYLRFAVFSSLAMGCQGIRYWTYHQRPNGKKELYLSAPIDREESKTPAWYYARRINAEIRKFNSVFRNATLVSWGHVGEIYRGCRLLSTTIGCIQHVKPTSSNGKGMLVTWINAGLRNYNVVVSHDVENYQEVSIEFCPGYTVREITRWDTDSNGTALPSSPDDQKTAATIKRTLAPGDYLIYSWVRIPTNTKSSDE